MYKLVYKKYPDKTTCTLHPLHAAMYFNWFYYISNHNYNKIVKSDWLSTALISALIGQFNRTVRVMPK